MDSQLINQLRSRARRRGATEADAEDLVQETLLAGWCSGRTDLAYLQGVLRNQVAMHRRGSRRRQAREMLAGAAQPASGPAPDGRLSGPVVMMWLSGLTPASRQLAILTMSGLSGEEIRWLTGLSSAAMRQRVATLRAALRRVPAHLRASLQGLVRCSFWPLAPPRKLLKAALPGAEAGMATHDTDGHVLVLGACSHVRTLRGN